MLHRKCGFRRSRFLEPPDAERRCLANGWNGVGVLQWPLEGASQGPSGAAEKQAATDLACLPPVCRRPYSLCQFRSKRWSALMWSAGAHRGASASGSSRIIYSLVPRQTPRLGMTGELSIHPPDGVAAARLPQRSTTLIWQVSPSTPVLTVPSRSFCLAAVSAPIPKATSVSASRFTLQAA